MIVLSKLEMNIVFVRSEKPIFYDKEHESMDHSPSLGHLG